MDATEMHRQQPVRLLGWDDLRAKGIKDSKPTIYRKIKAGRFIADWQDDLRSRLARATLRFELIGLDPDEQKKLEAEVQEFKRVCRGLSFGRFECERRAA
jgi:hypothetical protein